MDTKINSNVMQDFDDLRKDLPKEVSNQGRGGKRSLYRPEMFIYHANKYGHDARQARNFVRKEFLNLCANLRENDTEAINYFNRYYSRYFLVNDYTLSSVSEKTESAQNTYDFAQYKRALAIAKKFANKK